MSAESLEQRVAFLERQLTELQRKLEQSGTSLRGSQPVMRKIGPDDPYWEERERRLAKINFIQPIDSTATVSEDRDRV